jgi:ferredoxin
LLASAGACSTPYYRSLYYRVAQGDWLVKVEVDRDSCEANAVCAGLVPEVFEVDDEDQLHIQVAEIQAGLEDAVRHAVRSCPKAALRLEE